MKHQDNLIEITFEIELLAVLEVQNKLEKSFIWKRADLSSLRVLCLIHVWVRRFFFHINFLPPI